MLTLNVPRTENPVPMKAVETHPKATSEWLARLPLASPADAAQQLVATLHTLNRYPLSADDRHALMALYRPVVLSVAGSLESRLSDIGVPPYAQQRQTGVLLRELLAEYGIGYKQLLLTMLHRRFGRASPRALAEVTTHLLNALRELQHACYLTYSVLSDGLWLEMHQLFQLAESTGLADTAIDGLPPASHVYRQALLLALADPPHMSHAELAHTRMFLQHLGAQARLLPLENRIPGISGIPETGFVVATDCDTGPGQPPASPKTGCLWLDTDTLCRQLHDLAIRLRAGEAPERLGLPLGMENGLSLSLGKRLIKQWRSGVQRAFKRYPVPGSTMQVVAGVSAIHRLLELVPQAPELDMGDETDLPIHDVETLFAAPTAVNASHWTIRNDSAVGLALSGVHDAPLNLKVGDALAVRPDDAAIWSLAVIRWIKMLDARQVELGVERLSPRMQPVWVRPLRGRRKASPEPALFVPGQPALKQPDRLLLPRNLYQVGMDAEVWHTPHQYTLAFGQRLERTPGFDLIDFTIFANKPTHD